MHGLPSSQLLGLPGTQAPAAQASPSVQTEPSEQGTVLFTDWQPFLTSHVSVVHGLPSSQLLGALGVQTPPLHASPLVHALLSEQATPLLLC